MAIVIKEFRYSANGFTVERMKVGDEREFGDATESLRADGFIELPKEKKKTK